MTPATFMVGERHYVQLSQPCGTVVTVDLSSLANYLGRRARIAKNGKASALYNAVRVSVPREGMR